MTAIGELVTIGIPVRNEGVRLQECLVSVKRQTYPNIEICISDNASSDNTFELAIEFSKTDHRVRVQRSDINLGLAKNFDTVRKMARGRFFIWLAADDRIDASYIESMLKEFDRYPQTAVAHSAVRQFTSNGATIRKISFSGWFNPNNRMPLFQAMNVLTPFKSFRERKLNLFVYGLYRKSVMDQIFDAIGNPMDIGDRILPALAALAGGQRYVDRPLFSKHIHEASHGTRSVGDATFDARVENTRIRNIVIWIWRCKAIAVRRRWYGLIIAIPFVFAKVQDRLRAIGVPPLIGTKLKF